MGVQPTNPPNPNKSALIFEKVDFFKIQFSLSRGCTIQENRDNETLVALLLQQYSTN
jgi:hypothetical protein